jgi:exosortase A
LITSEPTQHGQQASTARPWLIAGLAFVLALAGLILVLWDTSLSFVEVWSGGETYSHGFIILPISLWLVWQKRKELARVTPQPTSVPLLLVAGAGLVWVVGDLVGVLLVEQMGMVLMLIAACIGIVGWRLSVYLAFPLLFLLFAVPMGEELIPPMMEFTATFTVEALRLTGIPVYREGLWFVLPTGSWSVVEACSGVRYIIASVTLGFLYAYISYQSLWKRLLFILVSALVPVLANGVRAYVIVLIGHFSDMKLATGVDHLIYGWVFFGLIMLLLFWIGGFWQEEHAPITPDGSSPASTPGMTRQLLPAVGAVAIAFGALALAKLASAPNDLQRSDLAMPIPSAGWSVQKGDGGLRPTHLATDFLLQHAYRRGDASVALFVAFYPNQRQGQEAVAKRNAVVGDDRLRQQVSLLPPVSPDIAGGPGQVNQFSLTRRANGYQTEKLLVWQWHRIAGKEIAGRYASKIHEIQARLLEGRSDGAWIAIATPMTGEDTGTAQARLSAFLEDMYPAIERSMDDVLQLER